MCIAFDTKLWHYGAVALYQEFMDELKQRENKKDNQPVQQEFCCHICINIIKTKTFLLIIIHCRYAR